MGFEWGSFFTGTGAGIVQGGTTLGTAIAEAPQRRENLRKTKLENEKEEEEKRERERKSGASRKLAYLKELLAKGEGIPGKRIGRKDTGQVTYREPTEEEVKSRVDFLPSIGQEAEPEKLAFAPVPVFGKEDVFDEPRPVTDPEIEAAAYGVSPEVGLAHRKVEYYGSDIDRKREQFDAQLKQRYAALKETSENHDIQAQIDLMALDRRKMYDRFLYGKGTKDTEIKELGMVISAQRQKTLDNILALATANPKMAVALQAQLEEQDALMRELVGKRLESLQNKTPGGLSTEEFGGGIFGEAGPGMSAGEAAATVQEMRSGKGPRTTPTTQPPAPKAGLTGADKQAYDWATQNSGDARAKAILAKLKKEGKI